MSQQKQPDGTKPHARSQGGIFDHSSDAETPPQNHVSSPADQIISQIEELFPNWRSYRDLVDCITCEMHELRKRAEGRS